MTINARLKPSRSAILLLLFASACTGGSGGIGAVSCGASTPVAVAPGTTPSVTLRVPIGQLPSIDTNALLEHVKVLSSDEFEGRAPGTKGEDLSVNYIADEFKKAGLKPGNPDGTYFQKVPLVGITPTPAPLYFSNNGEKGSGKQTLKWKDDVVAWTKHVAPSANVENSEVVFVGYG